MFKAFRTALLAIGYGLATASGTVSAACYLHHGESAGSTAEDAASEAVASWVKDVTAQHGAAYADWRWAKEMRLVCNVVVAGSRDAHGRGWFCDVDGEARQENGDCNK